MTRTQHEGQNPSDLKASAEMHTKKVSTYELFSSKPKYYYFLMVEFEQMVGKVNSSNK